MDFAICIPTYKRPELLQKKTLAFLDRMGVSRETIHLLTSADDPTLGELPDLKQTVFTTGGLREKLNELICGEILPSNTYALVIEDDLDDLLIKDGAKARPCTPEEFWKMVNTMFTLCDRQKMRLWGVCPSANPFYMKNRISEGLKFAVANIFGVVIPNFEGYATNLSIKSDYERTIRFYIHDRGVLRHDGFAPKTANYKNAGGLQGLKDRAGHEREAVNYLLKRYPHFVKENFGRKSKFPEVTLTPVRGERQKTDWQQYQRVFDLKGGFARVESFPPQFL